MKLADPMKPNPNEIDISAEGDLGRLSRPMRALFYYMAGEEMVCKSHVANKLLRQRKAAAHGSTS